MPLKNILHYPRQLIPKFWSLRCTGSNFRILPLSSHPDNLRFCTKACAVKRRIILLAEAVRALRILICRFDQIRQDEIRHKEFIKSLMHKFISRVFFIFSRSHFRMVNKEKASENNLGIFQHTFI